MLKLALAVPLAFASVNLACSQSDYSTESLPSQKIIDPITSVQSQKVLKSAIADDRPTTIPTANSHARVAPEVVLLNLADPNIDQMVLMRNKEVCAALKAADSKAHLFMTCVSADLNPNRIIDLCASSDKGVNFVPMEATPFSYSTGKGRINAVNTEFPDHVTNATSFRLSGKTFVMSDGSDIKPDHAFVNSRKDAPKYEPLNCKIKTVVIGYPRKENYGESSPNNTSSDAPLFPGETRSEN